jgi:hypothetical protein
LVLRYCQRLQVIKRMSPFFSGTGKMISGE